jgi:hypothetical protein
MKLKANFVYEREKIELILFIQVPEGNYASDTGRADERPATFGYKIAAEVLDKIEDLIKI